ncbi:hypothetical protein CLF_111022 [Clonorchis sinensis]|uniref:Uncharacterized protein n=1 Tax=Clonorchis sinensis TaxID=79923 RepID=G7YLD1_CLOSI|nr:hypothetical protein CLF_111022 [Clonorchis sinensis]
MSVIAILLYSADIVQNISSVIENNEQQKQKGYFCSNSSSSKSCRTDYYNRLFRIGSSSFTKRRKSIEYKRCALSSLCSTYNSLIIFMTYKLSSPKVAKNKIARTKIKDSFYLISEATCVRVIPVRAKSQFKDIHVGFESRSSKRYFKITATRLSGPVECYRAVSDGKTVGYPLLRGFIQVDTDTLLDRILLRQKYAAYQSHKIGAECNTGYSLAYPETYPFGTVVKHTTTTLWFECQREVPLNLGDGEMVSEIAANLNV